MPRKPPQFKLYWVETDNHDEDWFIVARTAREAERFHEEEEGYARGEATATLVKTLVDEGRSGWPKLEQLTEYGLTVVRAQQPRIVEYEGVRYTEGGLEASLRTHDDDFFEGRGQGRPNGTERRPPE